MIRLTLGKTTEKIPKNVPKQQKITLLGIIWKHIPKKCLFLRDFFKTLDKQAKS